MQQERGALHQSPQTDRVQGGGVHMLWWPVHQGADTHVSDNWDAEWNIISHPHANITYNQLTANIPITFPLRAEFTLTANIHINQ